MSRIRLGQSAAEAATPTRARPSATRTEIVVLHAAEKRSDDQWYKSMSRSSPAKSTHVLKKVFAADPQAPPTSTQKGTNFTSCATRSCRLLIASFHRRILSLATTGLQKPHPRVGRARRRGTLTVHMYIHLFPCVRMQARRDDDATGCHAVLTRASERPEPYITQAITRVNCAKMLLWDRVELLHQAGVLQLRRSTQTTDTPEAASDAWRARAGPAPGAWGGCASGPSWALFSCLRRRVSTSMPLQRHFAGEPPAGPRSRMRACARPLARDAAGNRASA
eukprot:COSAG02_NODE_400_length_23094_cov_309.555990_4_plen_279_part_00